MNWTTYFCAFTTLRSVLHIWDNISFEYNLTVSWWLTVLECLCMLQIDAGNTQLLHRKQEWCIYHQLVLLILLVNVLKYANSIIAVWMTGFFPFVVVRSEVYLVWTLPSNHVPCCLLEPCCLITGEGNIVLSVIVKYKSLIATYFVLAAVLVFLIIPRMWIDIVAKCNAGVGWLWLKIVIWKTNSRAAVIFEDRYTVGIRFSPNTNPCFMDSIIISP